MITNTPPTVHLKKYIIFALHIQNIKLLKKLLIKHGFIMKVVNTGFVMDWVTIAIAVVTGISVVGISHTMRIEMADFIFEKVITIQEPTRIDA